MSVLWGLIFKAFSRLPHFNLGLHSFISPFLRCDVLLSVGLVVYIRGYSDKI